MAADPRAPLIRQVFQEIVDQEPAVTSADVLLEFARRTREGRRLRITRADAAAFLAPTGTAQVYKRVPVEWKCAVSKPSETDVRFDLDLWDGRAQAPETQAVKWVMLLQNDTKWFLQRLLLFLKKSILSGILLS